MQVRTNRGGIRGELTSDAEPNNSQRVISQAPIKQMASAKVRDGVKPIEQKRHISHREFVTYYRSLVEVRLRVPQNALP